MLSLEQTTRSVSADPCRTSGTGADNRCQRPTERNEERRKANVSRWEEWSKERADLLLREALMLVAVLHNRPSAAERVRGLPSAFCRHAPCARGTHANALVSLRLQPPLCLWHAAMVPMTDASLACALIKRLCRCRVVDVVRASCCSVPDCRSGAWNVVYARRPTPFARGSRV